LLVSLVLCASYEAQLGRCTFRRALETVCSKDG
jgi:hypothetical protein